MNYQVVQNSRAPMGNTTNTAAAATLAGGMTMLAAMLGLSLGIYVGYQLGQKGKVGG